jgi:hypothetical protein
LFVGVSFLVADKWRETGTDTYFLDVSIGHVPGRPVISIQT